MSAVRHFYKDPGAMACEAEGCAKDKNTGRYCSMHAMRLHRTKTLERLPITPLKLSGMSPLGLNITAVRFAQAMSMDQLAKRAETSKWTIGYICRGNSCSLNLLWSLAAVLNVEAWRLLKPDEFSLPTWFQDLCR